jgi:hypothetical protein
MNYKFHILIYIFLALKTFCYSQTSEKSFIDSLAAENFSIYIVEEVNFGASDIIGEKNIYTGENSSCISTNEKWIFWFKNEDRLIHSNFSNTCYELLFTHTQNDSIIQQLNQLFLHKDIDKNSSNWLERAACDSLHIKNFPLSPFYTFTKLSQNQQTKVTFSLSLFFNNATLDEAFSIENVLNKILTEYNQISLQLVEKRIKISSNWNFTENE